MAPSGLAPERLRGRRRSEVKSRIQRWDRSPSGCGSQRRPVRPGEPLTLAVWKDDGDSQTDCPRAKRDVMSIRVVTPRFDGDSNFGVLEFVTRTRGWLIGQITSD